MRILHLIDDLQLGGAERNLVSVVGALPQHQHRVVHLLDQAAYAPQLRALGAEVELVRSHRATDYPRVVTRLRELTADADVVHTQRWMANLLGRIAAHGRAPIVTTVQTSPYEPSIIAGYRMRGRALNRALWFGDMLQSSQTVDRVVGVSEYVRQMVVERLRVPVERTRLVYNAVAVDDFRPVVGAERSQARAALGLDPGDVAIVAVGHLVRLKQQRLLIDALPAVLRRAPHARLLIVGDGVEERSLRERAAHLGLGDRVLWLGLRKDVASFLGALDIFALASSVEGLPLSAVEAMSANLPCVLSPIPPHRELRDRVAEAGEEPAEGMVVAAHDADAWAAALTPLVLDPARRERLGRQGHIAARRHFDVRVTAPAFAGVLAEAIDAFASQRRTISPRSVLRTLIPSDMIGVFQNCGGTNFRRDRFAGNLADIDPAMLAEEQYLRILHALIMPSGIRKTTAPGRNASVIAGLLDRGLLRLAPKVAVLDIGASTGVDAHATDALLRQRAAVECYVLGDLHTHILYDRKRGLVFDQDGRLVQVRRRWSFVATHFAYNYAFQRLTHLPKRIRPWILERRQRYVPSAELVSVPLVHPSIDLRSADSPFRLERMDVFRPLGRRFGLIICMHLLVARYFSPEQRARGIDNLQQHLEVGGSLIVGSIESYQLITRISPTDYVTKNFP